MAKTKNIARQNAIAMIEKGHRARWWQRKGTSSRGFTYFDADGKAVENMDDLDRIASLAVPPAWRHVRICPSRGGRLQAIGLDAEGRLQYRYHAAFAQKRQRQKFSRIAAFGEFLPKFFETTNRDLSLDGLPAEKVLAAMMLLINSLYFRVGTDRSERRYKTFGITTLHKKHLAFGRKGKLRFDFVGKSHVEHRLVLVDEDLASVVKEIASIAGGRKLFRYVGENGKPCAVTPTQLNSYLKAATDPQFSAKDLRTWGGTLLAAIELAGIGPSETEAETKKNIVRAVKRVAVRLGNTPAVCRASYIHPAVLDAYAAGRTIEHFRPRKVRPIMRIHLALEPEETALLKLLKELG